MVLGKKHKISLMIVLLLGLGACSNGSGYIAYQAISKDGMALTPYVFDLSDSSLKKSLTTFIFVYGMTILIHLLIFF